MKKILAVVLALIFLIAIPADTVVLADALSSQTGSMGLLKDIKYSNDGVNEIIAVYFSSYSNHNVLRLVSPDRIVFDFNNTRLSNVPLGPIPGGSLVKTIRLGQFTNSISRVVLDTNGQPGYRVEEKPGVFYIYVPGNSTVVNGNDEKSKENQDGSKADGSIETDKSTETDGEPQADDGTVSRGGFDREITSVYRNLEIAYSGGMDMDQVAISFDKKNRYNIMRLTGPDRLVIDIPNINAPTKQKTVDINSAFIKDIRYAKYDSDTARVVLDVTGQVQYDASVKNGKLFIKVSNPTYYNISYNNNGDRVYFSLKGAKLTGGQNNLVPQYTGSYSDNGLKYTMTFPSSLASLGSGIFKINDGLIDLVEIIQDPFAGSTSITFTSPEKLKYFAITRPEMGDTTITVIKPSASKDKLVVIDAGHGGTDPGAMYGSLMEKDLNLDIAIRLNELLKKEKIKTYMLREDDSYVGLYERAGIANNLNASLFLSIHNNAMEDTSYGGTMTLYYPQSYNGSVFNGKRFAQIVQSKLLSKLGTTDRKIIERPNLVVLKATAMPAALAEVAFITNAKDRTNLQSPSFRAKAAQALCDSIIQALKELK